MAASLGSKGKIAETMGNAEVLIGCTCFPHHCISAEVPLLE